MKARSLVLFGFIFIFAFGILLASRDWDASIEGMDTDTGVVTPNQAPVFRLPPMATPMGGPYGSGTQVTLPSTTLPMANPTSVDVGSRRDELTFIPNIGDEDPVTVSWSQASGPKISLSTPSYDMHGGFPAPMASGKVVVKFSTGCGGVDPLPETWRQVSGTCGIHNRSISECEESCRRPSGWRQKTVAEEAELTRKNKEEE